MNIKRISLYFALSITCVSVIAAVFFDPRFQPIGSAGMYALSSKGLADGQSKLFRPYFDDVNWWGDLESYNVDSVGTISSTPNWSAKDLLDARSFSTRRILTRRLDGTPVMFADIDDLSDEQETALGSQAMMDFIRGDTSNEGSPYRQRLTVMGDVINSTPQYIEYDPDDLSANWVVVGANDGMLHIFNASTGEEEMAYLPSEVLESLPYLADLMYNDGHQYFVDGQITVRKIVLPDASEMRVLVGGLGAGGQAFYALDLTSTDTFFPSDVTSKLLWEVSDDTSAEMADLGFSYSSPLIAEVNAGSRVWAAIFGNGYGNRVSDSAVGSGSAVLYVVNLQTGALIAKIDTGQGNAGSPNGLSSPKAVDINADGIADYAYAGDLDGNVWRFDLRNDDPSQWSVSFGGNPFYHAENLQAEDQPITVAPRVLRHPDGGLIVIVGTGRTLSSDDTDSLEDSVATVYGLRDRLDGTRPETASLVVQDLDDNTYNTVYVRTSSNHPVDNITADGWSVDLTSGERVLTELVIRSGRVLFSSTNPTILGGEIWVNEIDYLTGGAPHTIIYDMNADGVLDSDDNVDGNGDGDLDDYEDRITSLYQGGGIVVSSPTLATLGVDAGIYFVNRVNQSTAPVVELPDVGLYLGHFDVDTTSYIAEIDNGSTDAHVHQYDDEHDVLGVDYFDFLSDGLHNITEDIPVDTRFKILIVNADRSSGGRLSINTTYDLYDPSSYTGVTLYDDISLASLPVYSLDGQVGTTLLTELSIYFEAGALIENELMPTATNCVRKNILSSLGDWRNGALTIWAVEVDENGDDSFTLTYHADDLTRVVGVTDGLLWESTTFWHWSGPCSHEYELLTDTTNPEDPDAPTVWEAYAEMDLSMSLTALKNSDKSKKKQKKKKGQSDPVLEDPVDPEPTPELPAVLDTLSPVGNLSNPNRVSWSELRR